MKGYGPAVLNGLVLPPHPNGGEMAETWTLENPTSKRRNGLMVSTGAPRWRGLFAYTVGVHVAAGQLGAILDIIRGQPLLYLTTTTIRGDEPDTPILTTYFVDLEGDLALERDEAAGRYSGTITFRTVYLYDQPDGSPIPGTAIGYSFEPAPEPEAMIWLDDEGTHYILNTLLPATQETTPMGTPAGVEMEAVTVTVPPGVILSVEPPASGQVLGRVIFDLDD